MKQEIKKKFPPSLKIECTEEGHLKEERKDDRRPPFCV
jgi:hypothetical protein